MDLQSIHFSKTVMFVWKIIGHGFLKLNSSLMGPPQKCHYFHFECIWKWFLEIELSPNVNIFPSLELKSFRSFSHLSGFSDDGSLNYRFSLCSHYPVIYLSIDAQNVLFCRFWSFEKTLSSSAELSHIFSQ